MWKEENCNMYHKNYTGLKTDDIGEECDGYMDYSQDTRGWSGCSVNDFKEYVNKQNSYCLDELPGMLHMFL